ncbi:MAG: hypothetical protein M3Q66_01350 [Chloroflexota bacterium]|nr:hypothetical protein [Chloroflexota bacterium]
MTDIGYEAEAAPDRADNRDRSVGIKFPRLVARPALKVSVFRFGKDVVLLATGRRMAVAEVAELLEDAERPIHRRWRRVRVALTAALDEFAPGDMTLSRFEDLEDEPALGRPAETARPNLVADLNPDLGVERGGAGATRRWARWRCGRSRSSHRTKYRRNAAAPCICYHLLQ